MGSFSLHGVRGDTGIWDSGICDIALPPLLTV